jgi:hypothetical protein
VSALEDNLDVVQDSIRAKKHVLDEARGRRDLLLEVASGFPGFLRSVLSGSVAHRTVNGPVVDADCAMVLDRRGSHQQLGPDGQGVGPCGLLEEVCRFLLPGVREIYPKARLQITKRALLLTVDEPVTEEEDPSVDLVVALRRDMAPGLWIPNTESNAWDPSHPERHTELLIAGEPDLFSVRRLVIRLAKAENRRLQLVSSFNLEAIAIDAVRRGMRRAEALHALYSEGAAQLAVALTPDPADVSPPIKCQDRLRASTHMRWVATQLEAALAAPDDERVALEPLSVIFPEQVPAPHIDDSKSALAAAIRSGMLGITPAAAVVPAASGVRSVKAVRAYGAPSTS